MYLTNNQNFLFNGDILKYNTIRSLPGHSLFAFKVSSHILYTNPLTQANNVLFGRMIFEEQLHVSKQNGKNM